MVHYETLRNGKAANTFDTACPTPYLLTLSGFGPQWTPLEIEQKQKMQDPVFFSVNNDSTFVSFSTHCSKYKRLVALSMLHLKR